MIVHHFFNLFLLLSFTLPEIECPDSDITSTKPVLFGQVVEYHNIEISSIEPSPTSEELAFVELIITGIPQKEEGKQFTLIGGGLNDSGFHGPGATGFTGKGIHFAIADGAEGDNPVRTRDYKKDYTRTVQNGSLRFDIYYLPTNITEWGERYNCGPDLALTLMRKGTQNRVLHADNNQYNWSLGGIEPGKAARITIQLNNR